MSYDVAITEHRSFGMNHVQDFGSRRRRKRPAAVPEPLYLVTQDHYDRLVENVINGAQPAMHLSTDWLDDTMALGLMFFPLATYERLRQLQNGNSSS